MKIRSATLEYQGQVFTFTSKPVFGATGAWVLEDVTGWFGGVGVRAETTDRLGHGTFQQRAWRSNRALTLAATYIAEEPDERLALQRALSGMLWAGDYGTLTVETDRVLSCPVRLDGEVGIVELGTHGVQLQVPLVSTDPWLYGEGRETLQQPQGSGVGLVFPPFTSRTLDDSVPSDVANSANLRQLQYALGTGNVTAGGGATVSASTSWNSTVGTSLKITPVDSGSSAAYMMSTSEAETSGDAGKTFTVAATIRQANVHVGPFGTGPRSIDIGRTPVGGTATNRFAYSVSAPNAVGETRLKVTFTLPADTQTWFIRLINGAKTGADPVWWDHIVIEEGDTDGAYFDGDMDGCHWETVPHRSVSVEESTGRVNLAKNPSFTSLFRQYGSGAFSVGGGALVAPDSSWSADAGPVTGDASLAVSAGTSSSSGAYVGLVNTSSSDLTGCEVTATALFHQDTAQTDSPTGTDNAVPRSLNVLARPTADSSTGTYYPYMWSNQPNNIPGTQGVMARFMAPDDAGPYQQWMLRLMNGSTATSVAWDDLRVTAERTPRATLAGAPFTLGLPPTRVMQGLERDWATGEWYTTQRSDEVSEDLWVQRLSSDGTLLETMLLPGAGHGGDIAIERDGDDVWWWGDWEGATPNRRLRVRFRDGTVNPTDPDVEVVSPENVYVRYSIYDGMVTERFSQMVAGESRARYRMFTLEDYKAGNYDNPVHDMTMPWITYYAFQGFAATDQYIYENGGGTRKDPTAVRRIEWGTADTKIIRTSGLGVDASGYDESEGITIDPSNGDIVFGKATGAGGARVAVAMRLPAEQFDYERSFVAGLEVGPLSFGSAVNRGDTITNYGNATAYPTHVITGDFPGGVSITQNKGAITYPWPLTKTTPLRIEASGSAWIGDTNVTARLTARDFNKFAIEPGGVASPRLTALQGGEGYLNSTVRDTYI